MDFSFIEEVGNKIYEILINDPDQVDWFYSIQEKFDTISGDPSNLISTIIEYLSSIGGEENNKIIKDIKSIIKEEENIDNLLSVIFFPQTGEEEEEAEEDTTENNKSMDIECDEDPETEIYNPQQYFNSLISKTMKTLFISYDIAYLLLKKHKWKDEILIQRWFSDQSNLLNSLHIKIGSKQVPNIKSALRITKGDVGECPICYDECPLFECYCGHKICEECIINDIKQQISENKVPVCRQTDEKDEICNCEFMNNDVKKFLENSPEFLEMYQKVYLDNEIVIAEDVRFCQDQYCNYVITPENQFPCHVGICPKCHSFACLKCHKGSHAPLFDCRKVEDFLITEAKNMQILEESQRAWFKHERKMVNYRLNHPDDVRLVFNEEINRMRQDHKQKTQKDQERIDSIENKIKEIEQRIKTILKEDKFSEEIEKLENEKIKQIALKKRLEMEKTFNSEDRMNYISTLEKEEQFFMSAILDVSQYDFYMNKFRETINENAIESISKRKKDDTDFIETISKRCPRCKTPIERTTGCNHMNCIVCHYEFCYVCGEEWSGHSDYFVCTRFQIKNSINFDYDYVGDQFTLPPMSSTKKAQYMRWNNLYAQYSFQFAKYNDLLVDLSSKENKKATQGKKILTFSRLCTRDKIATVFVRDTERKLVRQKTLIVMNTLLFAQSVLVWGPPALYYMQYEHKKSLVIEYKLSLLQESLDKFLDLINSPGNSKTDDFDRNTELLKRQIFDILAMAEE